MERISKEFERRLMLEGVRMERQRWLQAIKAAGFDIDIENGTLLQMGEGVPESVLSVLRLVMESKEEYAYNRVRQMCVWHIQNHPGLSQCATEICQVIDADMYRKKMRSQKPKEEEENPFEGLTEES